MLLPCHPRTFNILPLTLRVHFCVHTTINHKGWLWGPQQALHPKLWSFKPTCAVFHNREGRVEHREIQGSLSFFFKIFVLKLKYIYIVPLLLFKYLLTKKLRERKIIHLSDAVSPWIKCCLRWPLRSSYFTISPTPFPTGCLWVIFIALQWAKTTINFPPLIFLGACHRDKKALTSTLL